MKNLKLLMKIERGRVDSGQASLELAIVEVYPPPASQLATLAKTRILAS